MSQLLIAYPTYRRSARLSENWLALLVKSPTGWGSLAGHFLTALREAGFPEPVEPILVECCGVRSRGLRYSYSVVRVGT